MGIIVGSLALLVAIAGYFGNRSAIRREQVDRREALDLQREQLEAERQDREAQSRATITAFKRQASGSTRGVTYTFEVTNMGPANARRPQVWLRGEDGTVVAGPVPVSPSQFLGDGIGLNVELTVPPHERDRTSLTLVATWVDESGEHEEPILDVDALR